MFPKGYFPPSFFPPSYWPKTGNAAPANTGKGKGVGGKPNYAAASMIAQMFLEEQQHRNSLIDDDVGAAFVFDSLRRQTEWRASVAVNDKKMAEANMYTVLFAEL